jgi:hypothetical protein
VNRGFDPVRVAAYAALALGLALLVLLALAYAAGHYPTVRPPDPLGCAAPQPCTAPASTPTAAHPTPPPVSG